MLRAYSLLALLGRYWPLPRGKGWLVDRPSRLINDWPTDETFQLKDGRTFKGNLNDLLFRKLYLYGTYEPHLTEVLRQVVEPGDTAVDVGANIGIITLLLGNLVGVDGRVYSFEPNPVIYQKLVEHVRLNSLAQVVATLNQCVTAKSADTITLYVRKDESHACGSLIAPNEKISTLRYDCSTIALDDADFIETVPKVVKVDVEGAEALVLQGATSWCQSSNPPVWILEVNRDAVNRFHYEPEDIVAQLRLYGYADFFWSSKKGYTNIGTGRKLFPTDGTLYAIPAWMIESNHSIRRFVKGIN